MEDKKGIVKIFALAAHGKGISGGDRIFIELARNLCKKIGFEIFATSECYEMCKRQDLHNTSIKFHNVEVNERDDDLGFVVTYIKKIIEGIKLGFYLQYTKLDIARTCLYSSSDFWMDVFPCVLLKIRYPNLKWIATWYQTAPSPIKGFSEVDRKRSYKTESLFYWLSQLVIKPLINLFADFVVVNNEDEKKRFAKFEDAGKIFVMLGAVRLDEVRKYQSLSKNNILLAKKYDAVFQGRFHPQKGVVELIDIWNSVVKKLSSAKLAMIGDGPLMKDVRNKIQDLRLQNNIKLFGYVFDGPAKYKIFSQSKVVVHPAFYDSGGMASAEAMAFRLPCVGFDLISYRSYYPKGMIKVKKGDLNEFSEVIIRLLNNDALRNRVGKEALDMIKNNWNWEKRAEEFYTFISREI